MNKTQTFDSRPLHLISRASFGFTDSIRKASVLGIGFLALITYGPSVYAHEHGAQAHVADHAHGTHTHGDQAKNSKAEPTHTKTSTPKQDKATHSDVVVNVNGMVCSFCTSNIEKRFKKEKAIKDVVVNLDEKRVYLNFKHNSTLSDEQITSNIRKAGYNVVSIERR